jgi:hypothetical protein
MEESDQLHRDSVESTPCRRFTILDGMIVLVGMSVWFVQTRNMLGDFAFQHVRVQRPVASNGLNTSFAVSFFVLCFNSLIFTSTHTYMILRIRQPRPPLWHLFWQPGMLTSLIDLFYHFNLLFCFLVSYLIHSILYLSLHPLFGGPGSPYVPGFLVASGWLAAKLMGRFRPESGWDEPSVWAGWRRAFCCMS